MAGRTCTCAREKTKKQNLVRLSLLWCIEMMERAKVVRSFVLRVHEVKNCTYIVRFESVFVNGYKFSQQIET